MSRREQIAWAAGVFEGEGTVGYQEQAGRIRVRFAVSMTDEDVVRRFHAIMGCGNVTGPTWHSGSTKPQWRWSASSKNDAALVSDLLYPFLGERRRDALERAWHQFANQPDATPRELRKPKPTACPHGHPYPENLIRFSDRRMRCRECCRQHSFRGNRGLPAGSAVPERAFTKKSAGQS